MVIKKPYKKARVYEVLKNPELELAIRSFRPQFANDQDKSILKRLDQLYRDLKTVDNEVLRQIKKPYQELKPLTSKMKDILRREDGLISEIIDRNMDF